MSSNIETKHYYVGGTGLTSTSLAEDIVYEILQTELPTISRQPEPSSPVIVADPLSPQPIISEPILTKPFKISRPVVSGRWAAVIAGYAYDDEEVIVWNLENNSGFNLTKNFGKRLCYGRLCWSPNGEAIAVPLKKLGESGHQLWVFSLNPRAEYLICDNWQESIWSPYGQQIAYVSRGGTLFVADSNGQANRAITRDRHYPMFDLAWVQINNDLRITFVSGWPKSPSQAWLASLDGQRETSLQTPINVPQQSPWRCFDPSFCYRSGSEILTTFEGGVPEAQPLLPLAQLEACYQQSKATYRTV